MRSRQTRPVVYSGKVGAKMKPLKIKKEPATKTAYTCADGPIKHRTLYLTGDGCTMVLNFGGQVGRYVRGQWEPSCI